MRDKAAKLQAALADADPERFQHFTSAVERENRARLDATLRGIALYRRHPYRRRLGDPPPVWQDGTTALRDYGGPADGVPVLVVPSLINRAYILDLSEDCSLMRWLGGQGMRPFLVDWGAPGETERQFGLDDYIAGRLESALDAVRERAGGPVAVIGYCMGGLLALALAVRRTADVGSLALLACPWEFHAGRKAEATLVGRLGAAVEPVLGALGVMPVDMLQSMFASLDPLNGVRKFARFADMDPDSAAARQFVALEDWLNDGVPLAAPTARECLIGWYGENRPARARWQVRGVTVDPGAFSKPALCVVPTGDRIVPPSSARPLADALPAARTLTPRAGHIGMIAAQTARRQVWLEVAQFVRSAAT